MISVNLKNNPLKAKEDVQNALMEIIEPLNAYFETSTFGLKYDTGGAWCPEKTREVEALLRPLWGILPFIVGGGNCEVFSKYLNKIKDGTTPESLAYWGEITDRDQLMVEMASIGVGLCMAREYFWDVLTEDEQQHLYQWLKQINHYEMPPNNWLFFRILVNLGFKECGLSFPEKQFRQDLAAIDSYYLTNGWYRDGYPDQIDYYVPFAFHYYGLLYVKVVDDDQDYYASVFKERALQFAKQFRHFFAEDGSGIPYGRSLTYRFAQSSFWGALAFAGVEALPWGEIKSLCLQNLRHWFKQEIFSASGELTIGYYYRNLVMAESYNAFGSPYWALKSFIFLALPEEHPFWLAEEISGEAEAHLMIPEARMILQRDTIGNQVQMFTMGQHCEPHVHAEAKYEKFVYSTVFGFSVSKGRLGLSQGAFDNTLAVSEDGCYYQSRYGVETYKIEAAYLYSVWKPYFDVSIATYVIPLFPWHVRIHEIQTSRVLELADGGFAFDCSETFELKQETGSIRCFNSEMMSGIGNLIGNQQAEVVYAEPNTNLHFERTVIPTLRCKLEAGRHLLASAVLGVVGDENADSWQEMPELEIQDSVYVIKYKKVKKASDSDCGS